MYIIEDGKAYQIDGDVAYKVKFDANGLMTIDKESKIEVASKEKFTYDEMYRKLNVKYVLEQYSMQQKEEEKYKTLNSRIKELEKEIERLTKENKELKAKKSK